MFFFFPWDWKNGQIIWKPQMCLQTDTNCTAAFIQEHPCVLFRNYLQLCCISGLKVQIRLWKSKWRRPSHHRRRQTNERSALIRVPLLVMALSCGGLCVSGVCCLDRGTHSCQCDQSRVAVCVLTEEHSRQFDVCVDELSGSELGGGGCARCQLDLIENPKRLNQWRRRRKKNNSRSAK